MYSHKYQALTILELLIVMGIVSIVLVLGVWGMNSFQKSVTMQQAVDEVAAVLRETRSLAENNVLPKNIVIDTATNPQGLFAYQIDFSSDDLVRSICQYNINNNDWDCGTNPDPIGLKSEVLSSRIVYDQTVVNPCNKIIYENLTGNTWIQFASNPIQDNGLCNLGIKYVEDEQIITFELDAAKNEFTINY